MFIPIHRLPPYEQAARKRRTELPVTDRLGSLGLMLPTYPQLTDDDVRRVCAAIREIGAARLRRRRVTSAADATVQRMPRAA
jgi:dTDP-4-amino-4,6-dideoxygalactose transaminase